MARSDIRPEFTGVYIDDDTPNAARIFMSLVLPEDGGWNTIHWETARGWKRESYKNRESLLVRVERLQRRGVVVYVSSVSFPDGMAENPQHDPGDLRHPSSRKVA